MTSQTWLPVFEDFIRHLKIDSKEVTGGPIPLYDHLYGAQWRFLDEMCEGLEHGKRTFKILKARQLGISTISLSVTLFWLYLNAGLQGALVTDTEGNRDKFRILLERYIHSLPKSLRIGIRKHNRNNLVLNNGSVLDYLVAGTRKSGGLGRSRALNFLHATECSSYGDEEGLRSLISSLAQKAENRLYIFESTARGMNIFFDMWQEALDDEDTQKAIFIGWWAKEDYAVENDDIRFQRYWDGQLTGDEPRRIAEVKRLYNFDITPNQLAWHRWMRSTQITDQGLMDQDFPWTEEDAFVMTGMNFFQTRKIIIDTARLREQKPPFKAYRYHLGQELMNTSIEQVTSVNEAELLLFEEPVPGAQYVIGVDPAFGSSENKDRHCIEVYRCYADHMEQVAEYTSTNPETRQVTWVLAHLAGSYSNCLVNLEVSGPGAAVMQELKHQKQLLMHTPAAAKQSSAIDTMRWYLYQRPDSMGSGYVYNWKSTGDNKLLIMNQMRDCHSLEQMTIRSEKLLSEMSRVVQEGSEIRGEGKQKDDRVIATALAVKAWIEWMRPSLISQGLSRMVVRRQEEMNKNRPQANMVAGIVQGFFEQREEKRHTDYINARWN